MKIYYYKTVLQIKPGHFDKDSSFESREYNKVYENENYLVIDNNCLSSLRKEKDEHSFCNCLGDVSMSHHINDYYWGTSVTCLIYSDKPVKKSTIKNHIEKYISDQFDGFVKADLSFLKD